MALALVVSLLAAAATDDGAKPARFASPGLSVVNIDAKVGDFYTEHVAQQFKLMQIEIITVREIQSLLGMERQKQLLGCASEASSCIAELANALGADGVLLGDIARLGQRYTLNLKIIGAQDGKTLAVVSESAATEDEVVDALTRAAKSLATDACRALGRAPPRLAAAAPHVSLRRVAIVPLALGVAAAALGGGLVVWSNGDYDTLKHGSPGAQGPSIASRGQTTATAGVAALAVGGAALVAGVALFIFGGEPSPIAVSAGPTGGAVLLRGSF